MHPIVMSFGMKMNYLVKRLKYLVVMLFYKYKQSFMTSIFLVKSKAIKFNRHHLKIINRNHLEKEI